MLKDICLNIDKPDKKSKVRFAVLQSDLQSYKPWMDLNLISSYAQYYHALIKELDDSSRESCYITGNSAVIADNIGRSYIRDMIFAKLFTKNDDQSVYTYKGRLHNSDETARLGKSSWLTINNSLRWLIVNRSVKIAGIYYVFYDKYLRTNWHIFNSLIRIIKSFDTGIYGNNIDFDKLITRMVEAIGTENKLIFFGIGALTPGRMNIYSYREFNDFEIKNVIQNIVLYHKHYRWRISKGSYKYPNIQTFIKLMLNEESTIENDELNLQCYEHIKTIVDSMFSGKSVPNVIIEKILMKILYTSHNIKNENWYLLFHANCALVRGNLGMKDLSYNDISNEDVQITAGRLLALLHWEDFRCQYYTNIKNGKSNNQINLWTCQTVARQYLREYQIQPYRTWLRINFQFDNLERRLEVLGKDNQVYINLKVMIESILYHKDFNKMMNLDGRFLLGFEMQVYDLQSNYKNESMIEEENNEPEEQN